MPDNTTPTTAAGLTGVFFGAEMTPTETAAILRQFNEWRRGHHDDTVMPDPREIGEAIDAAVEIIERLEAAESDALEQARLNGMGASREAALMAKLEDAEVDIILKEKIIDSLGSTLNAVANERDKLKKLNSALHTNSNSQVIHNARLAEENYALRARIEATEKQGPVAVDINAFRSAFEAALKDRNWPATRQGDGYLSPSTQSAWRIAFSTVNRLKLYLAPGAQPTPSIPEGWLRAVDEALVVAHIGVANESDAYEEAKAKLDSLIGFHIDVATDPAVNGGYKLMPIEPTHETLMDIVGVVTAPLSFREVRAIYDAMLAAAPEAKS